MDKTRIFIVDDHEGFMDSAERFLSTFADIEVVGRANNGREALDQVERLRPDIVLMDLSMPEMGGLQATRMLKTLPAPPKVIVISHYDDAQHREHVSKAGADGFVSKLSYVQEIHAELQRLQGGAD